MDSETVPIRLFLVNYQKQVPIRLFSPKLNVYIELQSCVIVIRTYKDFSRYFVTWTVLNIKIKNIFNY